MRYALTTFCLLIAFVAARAFEPHFIIREPDETLSHLTINVIYQDKDCMIWIGTSNGLIRYTGTQFIPVEFADAAAQSFTAIFQDSEGTIWAGTESGNIWHCRMNRSPVLWEPEEGLPRHRITGILEDSTGQIWIGTYGEGLYVFSGGRLYNLNTDDGLLEDDIYAICLDAKDRVWAGTDQGVNLCMFRDAKAISSLTMKDGLPDQIIRCLAPDSSGNVWIGTYEGGIAYYDCTEGRIILSESTEAFGKITHMTIFEGVEVWIGTQEDGLWRYLFSLGKFEQIRNKSELQNVEIRHLLKDIEGNLWVVSKSNTILTAHRPFETLEVPVGLVQAVLSSNPGELWFGTDNGLYYATNRTGPGWTYAQIPTAPFTSVACLDTDAYGNIWVGSLDAGLSAYDPQSGRFVTFEQYELLKDNPIISFLIRGDQIWLATLGRGVVHARLAGNIMKGGKLASMNLTQDAGASHNFIFQLRHKAHDEVWLATDGAGLAFTEDNTIHTLKSSHNGPRTIYSITEDQSGHLWLVTPDDGLVEFHDASYLPLGMSDGLRSMSLSSVMTSHKGDLLLTHNKGIDVLIPDKRHFMYFDDEIGIKGVVPVLNAVCRDRRRNVWIGMENRIVKYTSLEEELSIHPRTWIAHISVNQKPVDIQSEHTFPASQNFFAFDYVGLWYTSPGSVKYLYTLQGHDLDWKESYDNLAIYSNLKPGKYTFKVRASENRFFYDEPLAEYAFEIREPFWQSVWFLIILLAAIGAAFYAYMKNREARLKRIEDLNKEKIESQLRALKAQINPHFLFNSFNTLITIIDENTGNPEVPIEYVEKLADFYRSILQYREEESISIPEEIQLVKNYFYLLQKRYGENLILDVTTDGIQGFVPPLVLQMLVENAVKHNVISKSRPLTIRIYAVDDKFLVVENNIQKKLHAVVSTRFGLQSIVKRYQLITDKKVVIEETEEVFRVSLPIIQIDS